MQCGPWMLSRAWRQSRLFSTATKEGSLPRSFYPPGRSPFRIQIVGKASTTEACDDLRNNLGDAFSLNMQMISFIPERYFRAAFRAAFLLVFRTEGYQYA